MDGQSPSKRWSSRVGYWESGGGDAGLSRVRYRYRSLTHIFANPKWTPSASGPLRREALEPNWRCADCSIVGYAGRRSDVALKDQNTAPPVCELAGDGPCTRRILGGSQTSIMKLVGSRRAVAREVYPLLN